MKKTVKITDLDFSFAAHPITGDLATKTGVEAIKQSVKTLLLLNKYEKPYQDLSTDIQGSLFEEFNVVQQDRLTANIRSILETYEPRIRLDDVVFAPNDQENALHITVQFTILGEKQVQTEIDLVLNRSR